MRRRAQYNFVRCLGLAALILGPAPAYAGTMAHPTPRDPLLDGGPTSPCAARADYADGTDANGRPVVPADVAAGPVPMPDSIAVPLAGAAPRGGRIRPAQPGQGAYVELDGRRLAPLVNPPGCPPSH